MKYILYLLTGLIITPTAFAAGIQVSPNKLNLTVNGAPVTAEILVANPTADAQIFEVSADDFSQNFQISPASFTLKSGASKTVRITAIGFASNNQQTLATNLSVVGKPLSQTEGVTIGTGVKIPLTVQFGKVSEKPQINLKLLAAIIAALGILAISLILMKKPR